MLKIAAAGHRTFVPGAGSRNCAGCGSPSQLCIAASAGYFPPEDCAGIRRWRCGSGAYAGQHDDEDLSEILSKYSEALGIAYQIRDDIRGFGRRGGLRRYCCIAATLPLALAGSGPRETIWPGAEVLRREPTKWRFEASSQLLANCRWRGSLAADCSCV